MGELLSVDKQKKIIQELAKKILENEFGLKDLSVEVLLDQKILVLRAENFICPAEIKASTDKESALLIHEVYKRQFDTSNVKTLLIENVLKITGKKVVSAQIGMNFDSRDFLITFFFI